MQVNYNCSICHKKIHDSNLPAYFPGYVCAECDSRAMAKDGRPVSQHFFEKRARLRHEDPFGYKDALLSSDTGPNPVFIDGKQCWRRYRLGAWITMKDNYNSRTLEEFEQNNFIQKQRETSDE